MRKPLAVLALALGAISVTPGAAFAVPVVSGYDEPVVAPGSVSSGTIVSGGTVEFCGDGFAPDTEISIAVGGDAIGTVTTDADGAFCVDVVLNGAGTRVLTATGVGADGGVRIVRATVIVTSTAAAPIRSGGGGVVKVGSLSGGTGTTTTYRSSARNHSDVSSLPRTGTDGTATQVWAGVGLLGLGGGLVALTVARRRETPDAA